MEFPWKRSGQDSNVLVLPGSGSEGSASEMCGDQQSQDRLLHNSQTYMLHHSSQPSLGKNEVSMCVHPSYAESHFPGTWCVSCTLGKGQRHCVDASLCIHCLCRTKASSSETSRVSFSSPLPSDLVYLIDFYPDGYYNTKHYLCEIVSMHACSLCELIQVKD